MSTSYINTEPESLASVVREYAVIYDRSHPLFHKKEAKLNAWNEVAEQLGIESGIEAERVFIRLRDKYARANKELLVKSCSDTCTPAELGKARQKVKNMFYLDWLEEFIKHRDRPTIRIRGKTEQEYDGYEDSEIKDPPTMHDLDFEHSKATVESPTDSTSCHDQSENSAVNTDGEPEAKKWCENNNHNGEEDSSVNNDRDVTAKSLNVQSITSWPGTVANTHFPGTAAPQAVNNNKRSSSRSFDDSRYDNRSTLHRLLSTKRKNSTVDSTATSQDEFDIFGQYIALKMRKLQSRMTSEQLEDVEFDILNTLEQSRRRRQQAEQVESRGNVSGSEYLNGQHGD